MQALPTVHASYHRNGGDPDDVADVAAGLEHVERRERPSDPAAAQQALSRRLLGYNMRSNPKTSATCLMHTEAGTAFLCFEIGSAPAVTPSRQVVKSARGERASLKSP